MPTLSFTNAYSLTHFIIMKVISELIPVFINILRWFLSFSIITKYLTF